MIDGFNLFYRNFHKLTEVHPETAEPIGGYLGFLKSINAILKNDHPDHILIVWDGEEAGLRRRSMMPGYKGRTAKARTQRVIIGGKANEGGVEELIDNQQEQLMLIWKALSRTPLHSIAVDYYEADDVIAHIARTLMNPLNDDLLSTPIELNILSTDRDYLQLLGAWWNPDNEDRSLKVSSPKTGITYTKSNFSEFYEGVLPENFQFLKILDGDPSDKIKGMKGWGNITARKLLPFLMEEKIESPKKLFAKISSLIRETETLNEGIKRKTDHIKLSPKLQKLLDDEKEFMLKWKLTQLTDLAISRDAIQDLREELGRAFQRTQDRKFKPLKFKSGLINSGLNSSHFNNGLDSFSNLLNIYGTKVENNIDDIKRLFSEI